MASGVKTGGRQAGTPNKLTKELRSTLKNILHGEIEGLSENLRKLDPKERLEILVKLLPYVIPKIEHIHYAENEPWGANEPWTS